MQLEAIQKKATELDLPKLKEEHVFEDRGVSGGKFKERKGLLALLEELKQPSARRGTLIVYRFNRLSRDTHIMMDILDVLEKNEIKLISVMEQLPSNGSSAQTKMMINIYSLVATFEREIASENKLLGLEQKRLRGAPLVNKPPFGYGYTKEKLIVNESELPIVRKIFDLYLTGEVGYEKIANHLNGEGYKYRGRQFKVSDIHYVLSNKTYYGMFKGGKKNQEYRGHHETVITKEEFDKVQELREEQQIVKKYHRKNWLQKKISCPICGWNLTPKTVKNKWGKYPYYFCANPECVERDVNADEVEESVKNEIVKFITKNPTIDQVLAEIKRTKRKEEVKIKDKKRYIKRTREKLFNDFEAGEIDVGELKQKLDELNKKLKRLPKINKLISKKEYLQALLEQQTSIKGGRVKDDFYFNLVVRVKLDEDYSLNEIYLKDLNLNIMEQEELVL